MIPIFCLFVVFTILPLVLTVSFRSLLVERKQRALKQQLDDLNASHLLSGDTNIDEDIEKFFSNSRLSIPAGILALVYALNFALAYAFIYYQFAGKTEAFRYFPEVLIKNAIGLLFAFAGVYTFNFGTMVRRLYLVDLSEHVFWGAINRCVLSFGIAVVLAASGMETRSDKILKSYTPISYFAIGYLANFFLDWVLQAAVRVNNLFNWSAQRAPEYSLQLVRGIDIWKEYRFEEEGIESIENLATADLLSLAVKTRYPIKTLVDWMDQAIVIHCLGDKATKLWENGIEASAMELASRSPANNDNNKESLEDVHQIALALQLPDANVAHLMNSLWADETVRTLWKVWQRGSEWASQAGGTAGESGALQPPPTDIAPAVIPALETVKAARSGA